MNRDLSPQPKDSFEGNPYEISRQTKPIDPKDPDQQWPVSFESSTSEFTGVILPLIVGSVACLFGLIMFALHLFVIRGGQISLHTTSTMPVICGVFAFMAAAANRKGVRTVYLWPQGIELVRQHSQSISWKDIRAVRVADSTNPGTIHQKVITLAGADNEPIGTISGSFQQSDELVRLIRTMANLESVPTAAPKTVSRAGIKKGRRTALITGMGALLLGSAGIFLPLEAYWKHQANTLMASNAIDGQGRVTERFIAPNGTTHRIRYDLTGVDGNVASHNAEVTESFYQTVVEGSMVDVRYVPDRPDISELATGQVISDDVMDSAIMTLALGCVGILATLFMVPIAILSWKGYDIDFTKGRFRIVPLG